MSMWIHRDLGSCFVNELKRKLLELLLPLKLHKVQLPVLQLAWSVWMDPHLDKERKRKMLSLPLLVCSS